MVQSWEVPGFATRELLAYGTAWELWCALEEATGDLVALKRLRPGAGAAAVDALRREADLLCAIDSPFVLRLRTVVGRDAAAVLVLDHAPGGSLARLLGRRDRLEPGEVVTVAVPLAQALAVAHARGLVHGDLSSASVLFTSAGMPQLMGFGLATAALSTAAVPAVAAQAVEDNELTAHLEPRVVAGGDRDAAADVWSLAALCHQMLAGAGPVAAVPADGGVEAEPVRRALTALAPAAPPGLVDVVERVLHGEPHDRPGAADLAIALQAAEPALPVRLVGVPSVAELGGAGAVRLAGSGSAPVATRSRPAGAGRSPGQPAGRPATGVGARAASPDRPATDTGDRRRPRTAVLCGLAVALGVSAGGLALATHRGGARPGTAARPAGQVAAIGPVATQIPVPGSPSTAPAAPVPPELVPAPVPPQPIPQWQRVLQELDGLRQRAYATGDAALLATVYVPGSTALAGDDAALAALTGQGRTATGVRHDVRAVEQLSMAGDRAELRVTDALAAQLILDRDGTRVAEQPGRGEARYAVTLLRQAGRWRIQALHI